MTKRPLRYLSASAATSGYADILRAIHPLAATFGLMLTPNLLGGRPPFDSVLARLEPFLVHAEDIQTRPGSRMADGLTALRHLYSVTPESLDVLLSSATSLYDWQFPTRPESLHLLRADGSTVLGTAPWHRSAWLELTESEYETLNLPETTWRPAVAPDTTTVLTDELLDYLLALSNRGDPVPWTSIIEGRDQLGGDSFIMVGTGPHYSEDIYVNRDTTPAKALDLDLIAASRTYLPFLVRELQRLRSQNRPGA